MVYVCLCFYKIIGLHLYKEASLSGTQSRNQHSTFRENKCATPGGGSRNLLPLFPGTGPGFKNILSQIVWLLLTPTRYACKHPGPPCVLTVPSTLKCPVLKPTHSLLSHFYPYQNFLSLREGG